MDLYDMLFGDVDGDYIINVHNFEAAIVEYMAGEVTRAQIMGALGLSGQAEADMNTVLDAVDALSTVQQKLVFVGEMNAVNHLAEQGLRYTTKAAYAARMGL